MGVKAFLAFVFFSRCSRNAKNQSEMTVPSGENPGEKRKENKMETKGYVRVSRQILSLEIWQDPNDCRLFLYCLMRASHNHYGKLGPGQLYYSVKRLSEALNMSRNTTAKHLRALTEAGLISTRQTEEGSVMTIPQWQEFCGDLMAGGRNGAEGGAEPLGRSAQEMRTDAQKMSTGCTANEHYQKETTTEPKTTTQRERDFLRWWDRYPRHEGKTAARNAWMNMPEVSAETLAAALENAKQSTAWMSDNGRYIPAAAKWLDGKWEDYVEKRESEGNGTWTEY